MYPTFTVLNAAGRLTWASSLLPLHLFRGVYGREVLVLLLSFVEGIAADNLVNQSPELLLTVPEAEPPTVL